MADRQHRGRLSVLRDAFKTQLWPLPIIGVALALLLGILLPLVDAATDDDLPAMAKIYLFGGGPDAARTVLSSIAGSLITVTSLTFSLTVVTLQLASSQFSPRLLRTFSSDRFVHVTLALFLGTFTYSLVVLRTVRGSTDTQLAVVPQVSVTIAVLLTVASVVGLVLFLAHLAKQIRVETILQKVHDEAVETLRGVLDPAGDGPRAADQVPPIPGRAAPLAVSKSGFLSSVDETELLEAAVAAEAVLVVDGFPGGSVVAGTPLGKVWCLDGGDLGDEVRDELRERIEAAIEVGPERTAAQDIAYGLRQLTDVVNKALSPGINDPTTAVHALGHISAVLCEAVGLALGPKLLFDDRDRVRVVLDRPDFGDLLDGAIAEPRRYGSDSPTVLARIARLLREVGWRVHDPRDKRAVEDQLARLEDGVDDAGFGSAESAALHAKTQQVRDSLAGRW